MLSILIPTYNTDIHSLVNTLIEQLKDTDVVWEIIFCEDASSQNVDDNKALLEDAQVKRLINEENVGRTATRNKLALEARYTWLLFLDADVLIKDKKFISRYLECLHTSASVIAGGTSYTSLKPEGKELRWTYGTYREAKNAKQRQVQAYYVISQNILIKKNVFLQVNTIQSRKYGLDNIFSYHLKLSGLSVLHIDNPIAHQGLENNHIFLKKSLEAIETLIYFEKRGNMGKNFTSLQKAYCKCEQFRITPLVYKVISPISTKMKKNLLGKNPSMLLFDLYRLYHYIHLKKNA